MIRKLWLIFAQAVTVSAGIAVGLITVTDWRPFAPAQEAVHIPDFSSAVERAAPAVVTIFARHATPGKRAEQIGTNWNSLPEEDFNTLGSGVLVSSDGFVLTNYHVVASIQGLYVGLPDSGQAEAVLVGSDPETDLALIKISGESGLPFIGLGDTSKLKVGQSVLAIGNPFDVGQTVTSGIISALGRHGLGLNSYEDFIQTDAAINQGNSGGALVNTEGELIGINTFAITPAEIRRLNTTRIPLIGINTAIFSPEQSDGFIGIGFAIPSSIISRVLPSLMEGKTVERGYLGFVPRQLSREFAMDLGLTVTRGVMVSHVLGKSPAGRAGLRAFDIVKSLNGEEILGVNRLQQLIARLKPGEPAELTVVRGAQTLTLTVTPTARPKNAREREKAGPAAINTI